MRSRRSQFWLLTAVSLLGAIALLWQAGWLHRPPAPERRAASATRGGRLVATYRSEPKTFNRLMSPRAPEELVRLLTHGSLVRVNRVTQQLEPRLATTWTGSPDGRTWTLTLRDGVRFSDGTPFTAADVAFTFRAVYDQKTASAMASTVRVSGQPLRVTAVDDHTVSIEFPEVYGPGLAILDGVPILPRHKLERYLDAGTFPEAWSTTTPLSEIAGLGPFGLEEYVPGVRLVFARNPHYWLTEGGTRLPHLDAIELRIVPEQNAEVLQLESGAADVINDFVRPEDLASFSRLAEQGRVQVVPVGPSINADLLWFNLVPGTTAARGRPWLQREELREAISHAVDRQAIIDTVYLGEGVPIEGPVTPGHGIWYAGDIPIRAHDPSRARALLQSIGLVDGNGDGRLEDTGGRPARFTIITPKGQTLRERAAAMIQQQLSAAGLQVDVLPLDTNSLIERFQKQDYDAIYFYITADSTDPIAATQFWLSSGGFHFWHPGQAAPATSWEAEIDQLMTRQATTLDVNERRRLFAQVQRLFADHVPAIYFAAPRHTVVMSARVHGATPSVLSPPVLWNAEALSLRAPTTR
jgi:peptide/nickel transport system substrate-binding protein